VVYLVMADDSIGRRIPFAFLSQVMELIPTSVATGSSSSSSSGPAHHSLQLDYESKLQSLLDEFNQDPTRASNDALTNAQNELNQVKDIMVHNVEQILSRGERIELLVDKTDNFAQQAVAFRRGARAQRRRMWWRNQRILWLSLLVGLIVLYLIVAGFCGLGLNHCRK
jgi:vesicle-associated membrane protein 7